MGEDDGTPMEQLFWNQQEDWSGRGDLNARPPAPKAVFCISRKVSVFKRLGFKGMAQTYCSLWNCEEPGGFGSYIFIYTPVE